MSGALPVVMKLPSDCGAYFEVAKKVATEPKCLANLVQIGAKGPGLVGNVTALMAKDFSVMGDLFENLAAVLGVVTALPADCLGRELKCTNIQLPTACSETLNSIQEDVASSYPLFMQVVQGDMAALS